LRETGIRAEPAARVRRSCTRRRDGDTTGREGSVGQTPQCFVQRKDPIAAVAERLHSCAKPGRFNIESGIPEVFVGKREAVIAEDKKAPAPPQAASDRGKQTGTSCEAEGCDLGGFQRHTFYCYVSEWVAVPCLTRNPASGQELYADWANKQNDQNLRNL
jgi:hypothetical protein